MNGSGKAHEKFLEVEKNNLGELMKEFNIEQTPPERVTEIYQLLNIKLLRK